MEPFNQISVIGLGYVGLPTAATIASRGVAVHGVDLRADVVERVSSGRTHIIEPDLDIVLHGAVAAGMLTASTKPEPSDAFIIAVPTPVDHVTRKPDMRAVESAINSIAPVLAKGNLVIIESTSPVGTTKRAAEQLHRLRADLSFPNDRPETSDVMMAYCPERILPGNTLRELTDNARLVGGLDSRSAQRAHALYSIFCRGDIHQTLAPIAEMAKLSENAFRDVNIAFANELSMVCELAGIDGWDVIRLANLHPRVNILNPGPGVGGHCIPVDPWFIVDSFPERARLIRTAREVNTAKQEHIFERVRSAASRYKQPSIAILGLSYKPDIDDLRESPSVEIAEQLARENFADLYVAEPYVERLPGSLAEHDRVHLVSLDQAIKRADVIAILVAHEQFCKLERSTLLEKTVIDAVGLLR